MLVIKPDFDNICWTHFHTSMGAVRVLQELPKPLRKMVSGFVGVLVDCGIAQAELRRAGLSIRNGQTVTRLTPFRETLSVSIRDRLELVAWWLTYSHRREIGLARKVAGMEKAYAVWHCPDCGKAVKPDRQYCANPRCPSWDKLYLCTQADELRPKTNTA